MIITTNNINVFFRVNAAENLRNIFHVRLWIYIVVFLHEFVLYVN